MVIRSAASEQRMRELVGFHVDFALGNADVIRVQDRDLAYLSPEGRADVRRLQAAADATAYGPFVRLAILTGMRRGELPNDTWAYRYFEQLSREGNPSLEQEEEQEIFASCMIGFLNLVGVVTISGPLSRAELLAAANSLATT